MLPRLAPRCGPILHARRHRTSSNEDYTPALAISSCSLFELPASMMPEQRQEKDDWNRYSEKPKQGTATETHWDLRYVVSRY